MSLRPTKLPEKHTIVNLCTTHASDDSVNIAVKGDDQTIDLFLPNCTFWRMLCRGSGLCPVVLSVVTVPRWSPLLYVRLSFSPKKTPSPPKPSSETLFRHSSALVPQTPTPLPRNRGHYQTKLIYSGWTSRLSGGQAYITPLPGVSSMMLCIFISGARINVLRIIIIIIITGKWCCCCW